MNLPRLAATVAWPVIPCSSEMEPVLRSSDTSSVAHAAPGALARLLDNLPLPEPKAFGAESAASGYVELLADVFEDGVLTEAEADALAEFAKRYSLTRPQAQAAHRALLLALARQVVEDGKVTRDERQSLLATAEALGLASDVVKTVMGEARASLAEQLGAGCSALPDGWTFGEPLRVGDGVVFTGCDELERARLEGRAQAVGLRVTSSVSRKTVILVTDGANSSTNKAQKARELGTRVVSPEVFATMVEFVQRANAEDIRQHVRSKRTEQVADCDAAESSAEEGADDVCQEHDTEERVFEAELDMIQRALDSQHAQFQADRKAGIIGSQTEVGQTFGLSAREVGRILDAHGLRDRVDVDVEGVPEHLQRHVGIYPPLFGTRYVKVDGGPLHHFRGVVEGFAVHDPFDGREYWIASKVAHLLAPHSRKGP